MLYTTHDREEKEATYVSMMARGMVDGLLLVIPRNGDVCLDGLRKQGFPHVIIDGPEGCGKSPSLLAENFQGAYDATAYLISEGHRKIGFISGTLDIFSAKDRLSGYLAALREHNIPVHPGYIQKGDFFRMTGYDAAKRLIGLESSPTAIFASNDVMAFGVMQAARELELTIPTDLSIVGFDDVPQTRATYPKLTTVRQPLEEMGQMAAEMLSNLIDDKKIDVSDVRFKAKLVIRQSSGPPKEV